MALQSYDGDFEPLGQSQQKPAAGLKPYDGDFTPAGQQESSISGEFSKGVSAGVDSLQGTLYGLAGLAGDAAGAEGLRDWGLEGYQRNQQEAAENAPAVGRFEDVHGAHDAALYAAQGLGQLVPFAASSVATGGIGGAVAKVAGRKAVERFAENQVAKGVARATAEKAAQAYGNKLAQRGAMAGVAANSIGTEQGSIYGDIYDKTGQYAPGTAAAYGAAAGALDALPEVGLIGRLAGRGTGGIARQALKQAGAEGATEGAQTAVENLAVQRVDPNHQAFDQQGVSEIANASLIGALGGGVAGGGAAAAGRLRKPSERMGLDPNAGPLSAAATVAVDGRVAHEVQRAALLNNAPAPAEGGLSEQDLADLPTAVAQQMFRTEADPDSPGALRYFRQDPDLQREVEVPEQEALAAAQQRIDAAQQQGMDPLDNRGLGELLPEVDEETGPAERGTGMAADDLTPYERNQLRALGVTDEQLATMTTEQARGLPLPQVDFESGPGQVEDVAEQPPLPIVEMDTGPMEAEQIAAAPVSGDPDFDFRVQKNGRPFKSERDVRLLRAVEDATQAGEQPVVVPHEGGFAVAVRRPPAPTLALPAPDTLVVDRQGNAQRGPVAPFVTPERQRQLPGGPGMDQQARPGQRPTIDALLPALRQRAAAGEQLDAAAVAQQTGASRVMAARAVQGVQAEQQAVAKPYTNRLQAGRALGRLPAPAAFEVVQHGKRDFRIQPRVQQEVEDAGDRSRISDERNAGAAAAVPARPTDVAPVPAAEPGAGQSAGGRASARADRPAAEPAAERSPAVAEPAGIDEQAHQAATSPTNGHPEPTPAQIEAGNYRKGHVRFQGLDISVENPRGSERSGTRPDGTEWRHTMSDHYGYIRRTEGADGEQVDVYLGPDESSQRVFVVDQVNQQDGTFDEHKVMLGYPDRAAAVAAYRSNFDKGWKVGPVTEMSLDEFKGWLAGGDLRAPLGEARTTEAASAAEDLPAILAMPKRRYIANQAKQEGLKKGSPGYDQAIQRLEARYEAELDAASAGLSFERYNALNRDSPASVNRQAWEALREEHGLEVRYSRAGLAPSSVVIGRVPENPITLSQAKVATKRFLASYNGNIQVTPWIRKTQHELYGPAGAVERIGVVKGAYHPERGVFTLASDHLSSVGDAIATLRHEILGHYGLDTFKPADKQAFLEKILASRNEPSLKPLWDDTARLYSDKSEIVQAEEVFARIAEQERNVALRAMDVLRAALTRLLRLVGGKRGIFTRSELLREVEAISKGIRNGSRTVQRGPGRAAGREARAGDLPADGSGNRGSAPRDAGLLRVGEAAAGDRSRTEAPVVDDSVRFSRASQFALDTLNRVTNRGPVQFAEHVTDAQRDALSKIGAFARKETIAETANKLKDRWKEKFIQGVFDQFAPIAKLDQTAYMQARLSKGTDGALESTFLYGKPKLLDGALAVDPDGKGLRGVLAGLKGEHDLFFAWMAGHRAERLAAEGRENLFTAENIRELKRLNQGTMEGGGSRTLAYAQAQKEFAAYQRAVLDVAEKAGLIDPEARKLWENEFYVPFYRVMEEGDGTAGPGQIGGLTGQRAFQKLKGGKEPLGDLMANTLANWSHLLTASMKNLAATNALKAAETMDVATPVREAEKGAVRVMMGGREQHYLVHDPLVLEALTMLHQQDWNNPAMKAMRTFKHWLTTGVTSSPAFRARNLLRDSISAVATNDLGYNPLKNVADGWRGTAHSSPVMQQLIAGGGAVRFGALNDGDQAAHAKRLIKDLGAKEGLILTTQEKITRALRSAWDRYQELGDRLESVNRAALYKKLREEGKSHLEASYAARDMMDFTSAGKWASVRFLTQIVPFMNARLQGMYKLGRGAGTDPRRFLAVAGAVAMASVLLHLLNKDDDEYKELPDFVRNNYWWVRLPGAEHALYIPKPFEVGVLGSVAERMTELATAGNDYRAGDFAATVGALLMDQLSMSPVPQAFKPAMEAAFNYDSFRKTAIDSMGQERLPPAERYTSSTSAAAVAAGRLANISPQRLEHLVRGYFGWLGTQALNAGDYMLRGPMDLPANPRRDLKNPDNWTLYGDFVKPVSGGSSKYLDRFYEMQHQIDQLYASASEARKVDDLGRLEELAGNSTLKLRPIYNAANRRITAINQRMRAVSNDPTLGAEEKMALLRELSESRNQVARQVDERARAVP